MQRLSVLDRGSYRAYGITIVYVLLLVAAAGRCSRTPHYELDLLSYMGNALLMEERDPIRIHDRVYKEIATQVPKHVYLRFTGQAPTPVDPLTSQRDRAANPLHAAEFLPFFAIRPIYNQLIWLLSKTGISLVRAAILISVASYFVLGIVLYKWMIRYVDYLPAAIFSLLTMLSFPVALQGRVTGPDGLSTLAAFFSLFLIFEKRCLLAGFALLLVSIFVRTDNVVLAGVVLLACLVEKKINLWQFFVLSSLALGSVLVINHAAGDYGIRMLYYRNFIGTPIAPAENPAQFSAHDYSRVFRAGINNAAAGFLIPFMLLGLIGLSAGGTAARMVVVTTSYVFLHYVILPNWMDRWFGVYYVSMGLAAVIAARPLFENLRSLSLSALVQKVRAE